MRFSTPVWVYALVYFLSIARLPFAIIPYLSKIGLLRLIGNWLQRHWDDYYLQAVRIVGDFLNVIVTVACFYLTPTWMQIPALRVLFLLALMAEIIRLVTEKGVMLISAGWQCMPHREIANWLAKRSLAKVMPAYCAYYALGDEERLAKVLLKLRTFAAGNERAAQILSYVHAFRIIPETVGLRCGQVRDVARGEIFIHARWTNQPGLLIGIALRRSPWLFDPRNLQRPFYYRTQANRLMTLTVFENAALSPWYAIYQFGHEVKSARYDAFYRILSGVGIRAETLVQEDGTYAFESLAVFLKIIRPKRTLRYLWTDEEVLLALKRPEQISLPSALEIAVRYTYPLSYVEEILRPKIQSARENASRTT
jgi:hypothetical protein